MGIVFVSSFHPKVTSQDNIVYWKLCMQINRVDQSISINFSLTKTSVIYLKLRVTNTNKYLTSHFTGSRAFVVTSTQIPI